MHGGKLHKTVILCSWWENKTNGSFQCSQHPLTKKPERESSHSGFLIIAPQTH